MNKKEKVLQEIQNCKSKEELMKVFEDNKIELNEEDLKKVSGGEWIDIVKKSLIPQVIRMLFMVPYWIL